MAQQFWVKTSQRVTGPLSPQQLKELAARGTLKPHHQISTDRQKWVPAARVKGLRFPEDKRVAECESLEKHICQWLGAPQHSRQTQDNAPSLPKSPRPPLATPPMDRATVISRIEEIAQGYKSDMSSADSRFGLGCLFTILFFPVAIPLFVAFGRRKRTAEATAKYAIARILTASGLNSAQLFTLAVEAPTAKAMDENPFLPLIDQRAFQQEQARLAREAEQEQRKLAQKQVAQREKEKRKRLEDSRKCPACGMGNPEIVKRSALGRVAKGAAGAFVGAGIGMLLGGGLAGQAATYEGWKSAAGDSEVYQCRKCGARWPIVRE